MTLLNFLYITCDLTDFKMSLRTWTHFTLIPGQTNFFQTSVALASPQVIG